MAITINLDSLKQRREFVRHPVNPGHNIYRILPPFGPVDNHNNYPFKRWTISWMINPENGRRKPFALPPFEKDNPDCVSQYVNLLVKKVEEIKKEVAEGSMELEEGKVIVKALNEVISSIRPKSTYFYNAVNKAGVVGILELKKTAHDSLKKAMFQYIQDYSQDPTSLLSDSDDSGVWFNVIRDGEKGDKETKYSVEKCQKKVKNPATGKLTFEDDQDPLPEHVVDSYAQMGYDVYNLYTQMTPDNLRKVLLFNISQLAKVTPHVVVPGFEVDVEEVQEVVQAPKAKPAPAKKVVLAIEEDDDVEEEIPAPKAKPVVSTKPKVPVKTVITDDDEFMSMANSMLL